LLQWGLAALATGRLVGQSGHAVAAPTIRQPRAVAGFDRVVLRSVGELTVRQAEHEALTVDAEARLMAQISTTVKDGTLYLETTGTVQTEEPIRFELTVRTLRAIVAEGSGDVRLNGLRGPAVKLAAAGSGGIDARDLQVGELEVLISGSGRVATDGSARSQSVLISGAADYRGERLRSRAARVTISGAGEATVDARDNLNVRISGSGDVVYAGSPRILQDVSGAGTVRPR
jgi:hypothetical protein